jgi:S-DNA-T family DNA segregation ATPase FtsK/SpoIIIE
MTDSLARRLMRDLLGPPVVPGPELVVEEGPAAGQRLGLPGPGSRVVVGRGDGAGWVVLDPDLSRAHAAIDHRADGVWLTDLGSKNGTRVDGAPAPGEGPGLQIHDGAVITLGKTVIRFRAPAAVPGGAATRTSAGARTSTDEAAAVPPRWPILLAAAVALIAAAVAIALAL